MKNVLVWYKALKQFFFFNFQTRLTWPLTTFGGWGPGGSASWWRPASSSSPRCRTSSSPGACPRRWEDTSRQKRFPNYSHWQQDCSCLKHSSLFILIQTFLIIMEAGHGNSVCLIVDIKLYLSWNHDSLVSVWRLTPQLTSSASLASPFLKVWGGFCSLFWGAHTVGSGILWDWGRKCGKQGD